VADLRRHLLRQRRSGKKYAAFNLPFIHEPLSSPRNNFVRLGSRKIIVKKNAATVPAAIDWRRLAMQILAR